MADGVAPRRSEAHGCGHDSTSAEVHGFLNRREACRLGIRVAKAPSMLKLLGSYALAKLLGFGLIGAIVIYAILSLLS
jgi:hypothetical protein